MLHELELLKSEGDVIELADRLLKNKIPNIKKALTRSNLSLKKLIGIPIMDYEWVEKAFREDDAFKNIIDKSLPSKFAWYVKALAEGVGPFSLVSNYLLSNEYNLTKRDWKINNVMDLYGEQKFAWMTEYPDAHEYIRQVDFYFPATRFWFLELGDDVAEKLASLDYTIPECVASKQSKSGPESAHKGRHEGRENDTEEGEGGEEQLSDASAASVKLVRNPEVISLVEKASRKDLRSIFVMSLDCYILDMVYSNVLEKVKELFDCKITTVGMSVKHQFGNGGHPLLKGLSDGDKKIKMNSFLAELERLRGHILKDAKSVEILGGSGVLYSLGKNPHLFSSISGKVKPPKKEGFSKLIIQNSAAASNITMCNFRSLLKLNPHAEVELNKEIAALTSKYFGKCVSSGLFY